MPNYNVLHIETLEVILIMHEKHHVELLADRDVKPGKIITLQRTIAKVKHAIGIKSLL